MLRFISFFFAFTIFILTPIVTYGAAPTWTAYEITGAPMPEGIDILYSEYEGGFGMLFELTGATMEAADGYYRLYYTNSVDGSGFGTGGLIEDVPDAYAITGSSARLSFNEMGQYVYIRPRVNGSDSTKFNSAFSNLISPSGFSQNFSPGSLLPEVASATVFITGLYGSDPVDRKIVAYFSQDQGANFTQVDIATNLTQQPINVQGFRLSSGYAAVWAEGGGSGVGIKISTSTDGTTWSTPIENPHASTPLNFVGLISAAKDSSDNIYVAFPHISGNDFESLDFKIKLAKFPAGGSAWDADESITNFLAPNYVPNLESFGFHGVALDLVNGTIPLVAFYELGSQYETPSAPGSIKYALREAGSGCDGPDGASFTCGFIDTSLQYTVGALDSYIPKPIDLAIYNNQAVVAYIDTESGKFRAAYTTITLDEEGGGGGGGGGGIPEFSDYVYIATIIIGALYLKTVLPKHA